LIVIPGGVDIKILSLINPNIILTCLLARKKDYKDLEKYLSRIKRELNL